MGTTAAGVMTMCIIAEIKLSTSTYNNFYLKEDPNVPKMSLAFEILQISVLHETFIVSSDDYWILRYNNEKIVMWLRLKQNTWLVFYQIYRQVV